MTPLKDGLDPIFIALKDSFDIAVISKEGFSAGGDSGSLILDNERYAVGKLFAGSDEQNITIANPVQNYLDLLDAELITE